MHGTVPSRGLMYGGIVDPWMRVGQFFCTLQTPSLLKLVVLGVFQYIFASGEYLQIVIKEEDPAKE